MSLEYLHGVLDGDGWIDRHNASPRICLDTVTKEFANEFYNTLLDFDLTPRKYIYNRDSKFPGGYTYNYSYFRVACTCSEKFLEEIKHSPINLDYVKGFFDSDGCYYIKGRRRKIGISNKDTTKLERTKEFLNTKNISSNIYGGYGNDQYELCIQNKAGISKFMKLIPSWKWSKYGK